MGDGVGGVFGAIGASVRKVVRGARVEEVGGGASHAGRRDSTTLESFNALK